MDILMASFPYYGIEAVNISSAQRENLGFVFNSGFVKVFSSFNKNVIYNVNTTLGI